MEESTQMSTQAIKSKVLWWVLTLEQKNEAINNQLRDSRGILVLTSVLITYLVWPSIWLWGCETENIVQVFRILHLYPCHCLPPLSSHHRSSGAPSEPFSSLLLCRVCTSLSIHTDLQLCEVTRVYFWANLSLNASLSIPKEWLLCYMKENLLSSFI